MGEEEARRAAQSRKPLPIGLSLEERGMLEGMAASEGLGLAQLVRRLIREEFQRRNERSKG